MSVDSKKKATRFYGGRRFHPRARRETRVNGIITGPSSGRQALGGGGEVTPNAQIIEKEIVDTPTLEYNEELEMLEAIYGDEMLRRGPTSFLVKVKIDHDKARVPLEVRVTCDSQYPNGDPPFFLLEAPWLTTQLDQQLTRRLMKLWFDGGKGTQILYAWIEHLREAVAELLDAVPSAIAEGDEDLLDEFDEDPGDEGDDDDLESPNAPRVEPMPGILATPAINDRKSKFIAFIARVNNIDDVRRFVETLLSVKHIADSTHNMYAYRVGTEGELSGRDDDGEHAGADCILHVLKAMKAVNLVVMVSRWFGGIMLGPMRFRHITEITGDAIALYRATHGNGNETAPVLKKLTPIADVLKNLTWDARFIDASALLFDGKVVTARELQQLGEEELKSIQYKVASVRRKDGSVIWDKEKGIDYFH